MKKIFILWLILSSCSNNIMNKNNQLINEYNLSFNTNYGQFFISDKFSGLKDLPDLLWSEQENANRLAVGDGILSVAIGSEESMNGKIVILKSAPSKLNFPESFDHIVEGSINLKSGIVHILDCPFGSIELEINLPVGEYRIRISSSNLDSVSQENRNDFYLIEIWPQKMNTTTLIKKWSYNS